jgi:hypothetical protein
VWKKIKIIGASLLLALILAGAGAAFLWGDGGVTVVAPETASVRVTVDGKEVGTVVPGAHQKFSLAQGAHDVKVASSAGAASQYHVEVKNGGFDRVLPVGKQCFAVFDITNYWYEKKKLLDRLSKPIVLKSKFTDGAPFDTPTGVYFSTNDLPLTLKKNKRANLFLEMPCQTLAGTEQDIVAAAFH